MPVSSIPAVAPFPELTNPPADFELSIWLSFAYDNYERDHAGEWPDVVTGDYVLACGRESGRWRLRVSPILSEDGDGEQELGPDVLTLRDQSVGADPLALLRALLSGGSA